MTACPRCEEPVRDGVAVCVHCLFVIDRERWQHDAGQLGADGRGGGRPLEDPPVGPVPLTHGGMEAGAFAGAARLFGVGKLRRWGTRR